MLKSLGRIALLTAPGLLFAQPKNVGSVRGVVYDSITRTPVAKAAVWVSGSSRSTVADANGRFEISDVPIGTQFISFSSPTLDSLGLGTLDNNITVQSNATNQVRLAVPSFRSIWRALCADGAGSAKDSGIVWGTIRDAATDPEGTTEVKIILSPVNELATVLVRDKNMGRDRSDFESRRAAGFGRFFDEKDFKNQVAMATVLQGAVAGADIRPLARGVSITMNQQSFTKSFTCVPTVWLDGIKTDIGLASSLPLENYRAVEIYPHVGSAPPAYIGFNACGVVLFWTKSARW